MSADIKIQIANLRGNAVKFINTIKDYDGTPMDPDTQEITVYDTKGVLQATITNPTQDEVPVTGVWFFYYTIPEAGIPGEWSLIWKATKGGRPSRRRVKFPVTS